MENKLCMNFSIDSQINVEEKKLEIKKSTIGNESLGVFASEFIQKGTIFFYCSADSTNCIANNINDLAYYNDPYYNDPVNYGTEENLTNYINVQYMENPFELCEFHNQSQHKIYLEALKDIQNGEELSRCYGLKYWQSQE
ncbi:MAG: hypothetical protein Satyrvirus1_10 [Satyrvirus sp.]|uniref:SET domain-containing protein n=1 Tax=Satyrvirus sp. TaxID=2487771 RepID=A0A3G5AEA0_9VIRU|nr:MAG: hypothetical protein Satyrvirus1_10 [Satyrvirus sp.]